MKRAQKRLLLFTLITGSLFLAAGHVYAFSPIVFGDQGAFLKIDYQGQLYGVWRDTGTGNNGQDNSTDFSNEFRVYAGKQKIQLTRENLEDCFEPLSLDRSLFIYTLKHSRDTGVVVWGNLPTIKSQYKIEVSKGNDGNNSPESNFMYTGRFHVSLWDPEYAYGYKGTYLGKKKVLTFGVGAQVEPDAVYSDTVTKTDSKTYYALTADAFMEYPLANGDSAVTLSGAYLKVSFDDAYQESNPDPNSIGQDGEKKGWYVKAAYLLPNRIGPGQVQPFVRYEHWSFADLFDVFNQKINWTGAGVNYLIDGQSLRVTLQYSRTDFDKEVNAQSKSFNTVTAMLQFRF
ncbi:MAG: selenite/tellurite reduction operon porin ExtI [Deltaproteobacteria bacterium]